MIAAFVKFELKDEVRKKLSDIDIARKHIQNVVEGCRKIAGLKEKILYHGPGDERPGSLIDMGITGTVRCLFEIGRIQGDRTRYL
jgi:hypothetical protein